MKMKDVRIILSLILVLIITSNSKKIDDLKIKSAYDFKKNPLLEKQETKLSLYIKEELSISPLLFNNEKNNEDVNETRRAFTVNDLHQLNKLSNVLLSPDNQYLIYKQSKWSLDTKLTTSDLFYSNVNSPKEIVKFNVNGSSIQFAKNISDKIFFLSKDQKSIVYTDFPVNEKSKDTILVTYPIDIEGFRISDNANAIVFHCKIFFGDGNDLNKTKERLDEISKRGSNTWREYNKLMTNHWDIWKDGRIFNVFHQKLKKEDTVYTKDGDAINLMKDLDCNSPIPPFGGVDMYTISPDGTSVAFTGLKSLDEAINTNWKTYVIQKVGETDVKLINDTPGRTQNPKFSSDGKKVFFLTMPRPHLESDYLYLASYDIEKDTISKHTNSWDYSIVDYTIIENKALFTANYDGSIELFSCKLDFESTKSSEVIQLTKYETFFSSKSLPFGYKVDNDKINLFMIESSSSFPQRIISIQVDKILDVECKKLGDVMVNPNIDLYDNFYESKQIKFSFKGASIDNTQGWLFTPIKFDEKIKYPVALLIHGGPEGSWGNSWSYGWNPLLWTSQGYAVIMINPEGSIGKGQKFVDSVRNDWGGKPYESIMLGLDYALQNYKWLDGDNACAAGGSYGGYMVNWIQGKTKRFKCLATHDGVFSTVSMYYITDEMWFPRAEYCEIGNVGCNPFDSDKIREGFTKYSPETLVDNWSTPHLVIHGSLDLRIPISEGISIFSALQMKGVPSKLLHYPNENHWTLNQMNSIAWYENVLGWFDQYTTKPNEK